MHAKYGSTTGHSNDQTSSSINQPTEESGGSSSFEQIEHSATSSSFEKIERIGEDEVADAGAEAQDICHVCAPAAVVEEPPPG